MMVKEFWGDHDKQVVQESVRKAWAHRTGTFIGRENFEG